jgi:hypothetical protein
LRKSSANRNRRQVQFSNIVQDPLTGTAGLAASAEVGAGEKLKGGGLVGVVLGCAANEKGVGGLVASDRTGSGLAFGELVGLGAVKEKEGAGVDVGAEGRPSPIAPIPLPAADAGASVGFLGMAKKSGTGVFVLGVKEDKARVRGGFT